MQHAPTLLDAHLDMALNRRELLVLACTPLVSRLVWPAAMTRGRQTGATMYGLIGKMTAVAGQRDALAAILLENTQDMPGCLSYVIATDPADADALWITEVWESQESHVASLSLPGVKTAIAQGRPLIAGFSNRVETTPLGGLGVRKSGQE